MMRLLIGIILALFAAVGIAWILKEDPGYALLSIGHLTIETSLAVFVVVLIAAFGLLQPRLSGSLELIVLGAILIVGIAATIALPGSWTKARTIEGIAGAADDFRRDPGEPGSAGPGRAARGCDAGV